MKEQVQAPQAESKEDNVNRRLMFGAGVAGVVGLLAAACSGSSFVGSAKSKKSDSAKNNGKGGDDSGGDDSGGGGGKDGDDIMPTTIYVPLGGNKNLNSQAECKASDGDIAGCKDGVINGAKLGTTTVTQDGKTYKVIVYDPANPPPGAGMDNGGGVLGDGTDASAQCFANTATAIDPNAHPDASGDLVPKVVFYGKAGSALVAVQFTTSKAINQIVVTTPSGKLIALHGITAADKDGSGKYRPMVMDNVFLMEGGKAVDSVKILIQMDQDTAIATVPVAFMTTYNGKPVLDLSGGTVPAGFAGHQSVCRFTEGAGTFNVDKNETYPNKYNSDKVRNLQTAKSGTTWSPVTSDASGFALMGTVTDIMGNTIDVSGSGIIEHQLFVTYVDTGAGSYARTMLHIG